MATGSSRIRICKREKEWERLKIVLNVKDEKECQQYIRVESRKLANRFIESPESFVFNGSTSSREEQIGIDSGTFQVLKRMAATIGKPLGQIIDEMIIVPLLNPPPEQSSR